MQLNVTTFFKIEKKIFVQKWTAVETTTYFLIVDPKYKKMKVAFFNNPDPNPFPALWICLLCCRQESLRNALYLSS